MADPVIWQFTQMWLALGLVSVALCFHKSFERFGEVFLMYVGGISWIAVGLSTLRLKFIMAGSTNIITWTYIPSAMSRALVYGFSGVGLLMILVATIRVLDLSTQQTVSAARAAFSRNPNIDKILGEYE